MKEKEINRILNPQRKFAVLFLIYVSIAFIFIGLVLFMKFTDKKEEPLKLSEFITSDNEKEGQYVEIDIDTLPILITPNSQSEEYFYYVKDINNNTYIVNLSNKTFEDVMELINLETGKLNSIYQIKGITRNIDEQIKNIVLTNSYVILKNHELSFDNFSEYFGEIYIKDSSISERLIILYTISVLFGLFFLILAFGYIIPSMFKARKVSKDIMLLEDLRKELENMTDTPYKKMHIYLTKNYIVSGIQAVRYEDIIWAYILQQYKYGIKAGENLIVHTKDNRKYIVRICWT